MLKTKKNILSLYIVFLPFICFAQSHYIDVPAMQMTGNTSDYDISINTYYNSLDSCYVSWNVIEDSVPSQWEFSFCFPNCYNIGINSGTDLFLPNQQNFLNCHIYPNAQVGTGIIKMEITTNNLHKDTVTWIGHISSLTSFYENGMPDLDEIRHIYDINGKSVKHINKKGFYIVEFNNKTRKIYNLF